MRCLRSVHKNKQEYKGKGAVMLWGRCAYRRGSWQVPTVKTGTRMGPGCILTTLPRITFLLEEWDEELSHSPIQDLTGRPRHHMMTDAPDPWKAREPLLSPSPQSHHHASLPAAAHLLSSHASPLTITDSPQFSLLLVFTEARPPARLKQDPLAKQGAAESQGPG